MISRKDKKRCDEAQLEGSTEGSWKGQQSLNIKISSVCNIAGYEKDNLACATCTFILLFCLQKQFQREGRDAHFKPFIVC